MPNQSSWYERLLETRGEGEFGLNFRVAFLQERVGFAKLLELSKNRFHLAGQIRSLDVDIEHGIH